MPDRSQDEAFSQQLRRSGLVSDEQLWAALKQQARLAERGEDLPLAEVLVREGILSAAQRQSLETKLRQSQHLGSYRIVRKLGEGGMGAVYLCADPFTGGKVAIKVLPKVAAKDEDAVRRFMREVESAQKLQHRNIVLAYGSGEDRGLHYYVMEYVEGETLGARLKREEAIPPDDAAGIVLQIAQALRYAHDLGFVHRDIKPDNIVVTPEGVAKILDMGLSKNIENVQSFLTLTGVAMGTPHYMAPEQARGGKVDGRADLYALGATYYHLLTGETPFHGATAVELIAQHLNKQLPDPRDIRDGIPDGAAHVIRRMMAKRPEDRYKGCAELIADLELVRRGSSPSSQAIAAEHSSVALPMQREARERYRAERQKSRKGTYRIPHATRPSSAPVVAGVTAIAVALIVVLVLATGGGSRPATSPVATVPERTTPSPAVSRPSATETPAPRSRTAEERREAEAALKLNEIQELDKGGRFAADEIRRRYEEFARAYADTPQGKTIADWLTATRPASTEAPAGKPKPEAPVASPDPPPKPDPVAPAPTAPSLQADASRFVLTPGTQGRQIPAEGKLALHNNGRAQAPVAVPETGTYEILVTASSLPVKGEHAKFRVLVDDVPVGGELTAGSATPETYKLSASLQAGEHQVAVQFLNDLSTSESREDRNLFLHSLVLVRAAAPAPAAVSLRRGLAGHWTFDEGRGTVAGDASGNGRAAHLVGSPAWTAGRVGGGLQFSGTGSGAGLEDVTGLALERADFTVCAWVRADGTAPGRMITRWQESRKAGWVIDVNARGVSEQAPGFLRVKASDGSASFDVAFDARLGNGVWRHAAVVFDRTRNRVAAFVDGKAVGSETLAQMGEGLCTEAPLHFGYLNVTDPGRWLQGALDDIRLYDRALTAEEIGALAEARVAAVVPARPAPRRGLAGHWKLDEGAGDRVRDSSGGDHDGVFKGSIAWAEGKAGKALSFQGPNAHVRMDGLALPENQFTLAAWVQHADFARGTQRYVSLAGPDYDVASIRKSGNTLHGYVYIGRQLHELRVPNPLSTGRWHHVAGTWDGAFLRLFVDGKPAGEKATSGTMDRVTSARISHDNGESLQGSIDDVRIFNRALSPAEVASLVAGRDPVMPAPPSLRRGLVGHWTFDSPLGTTAADSSGRGRDALLRGGAARTEGRLGGALALDGKESHAVVPDHDSLHLSGDLTIAVWVRIDALPGDWVRLVGKGNQENRDFGIWASNDVSNVAAAERGRFLFQQRRPGKDVLQLISVARVETGRWVHLGCVISSDRARLYIDGNLDGESSRSNAPVSTAEPLMFGYAGFHDHLHGALDDIRLYDRALSDSEIARLARGEAEGPVARAAVPAGAALREAEASVRKSFRVEQAKTAAEKSDLAKTILQSASAAGESDLYARLKLGRDLAAEAADAETALWAIDEMAAAFEVSAIAEKVTLLTRGQVRGADAGPWALKCLEAASEAVAADEFESAVRLATRAEALARATNDPTFHAESKERLKETQEIRREAENLKPRFGALLANPEDPAANFSVGRFTCLLKGDWELGLPMLAKGSDAGYRSLAEQELAGPADGKAQAALGEAWAAQAERETTAYKARARARAVVWLERALAGLTGFEKLAAERKLATLLPPEAPVDLLRLIDLNKDVIAGVWRKAGATLVTPQAAESRIEDLGRIVIPYIPPDEYDLTMTVTLLDETKVNSASLDIALPIGGGARIICVTDAGKGPHSTMLYNLDGKGLQNETTQTKRVHAKGRTRTITYSIRKGSVTVLADGAPIIRWSGDFKRFSAPDSAWTFTSNGALAIGAWTHYQISRITLTPVSGGKGRPLR